MSSTDNGAVFYSNDSYPDGPHYNRDRADSLIDSEPEQYTRLENTPGGEWLDDENLYENFDQNVADQLWEEASEKYASSATGEVNTFVVGAHEDRIFRDTELPALLENEKVTAINGLDREEVKELHDKDPEAAFNKVCEAELERDRTAAMETGDSEALNDVANREQLYQEQLENQGRTLETATEPREPQTATVADAPTAPMTAGDKWAQDQMADFEDLKTYQPTQDPNAQSRGRSR